MKDKDSSTCDKRFKIRKLLDLLLPRLREVYNPERQLAADETHIRFKGRVSFR